MIGHPDLLQVAEQCVQARQNLVIVTHARCQQRMGSSKPSRCSGCQPDYGHVPTARVLRKHTAHYWSDQHLLASYKVKVRGLRIAVRVLLHRK